MTDTFVTILIAFAIIANAVSALLMIRHRQRFGTICFIAAWAINLFVFVVNWISGGKPPFANMFHVLSVLPLVLLPMMLFVMWREAELRWMSPVFPSLACVPLIGTLFIDRSLDWSLNPALDSPFFVPHVMSYCISYAMCGVAFLLGMVYFVSRKNSDKCLAAAHESVRIAVPFMTLGMCLGAIWAEQAWGIYWSWDAKETFSLVTLLTYLGFLHLMKQKHNNTLANVIQMLGFIALLGTFFGVNLLTSVHAY